MSRGASGIVQRVEKRFPGLVAEVDAGVRPLVETIDVRDLSRHNTGYLAYAENRFGHLVEHEKARFLHALEVITDAGPPRSVCDLGTFVPWLPVALARLGYRVRIVEKFSIYGESFLTALRRISDAHGLEVYDLDILNDDFSPLPPSDVVLLMAVVEHLNGTPRPLMERARELMAPDGMLVFEVPNIAEFTKRLRLLAGGSPLGPYQSYLESAYPYMGHNREMTVDEVRQLLQATGYRVRTLRCHDYSRNAGRTLGGRLAYAAKALAPVRNKGEAVFATAGRAR